MVCSSSRVLTSSDGTEIYADAIGDPTKPAIVFVHGFTLSAAVFDNVFINDMYTKEFYLVGPFNLVSALVELTSYRFATI